MKNKRAQIPIIKIFQPALWDQSAAKLVHKQVETILRSRGQCNILLTGGATAARMYTAWSQEFDIHSLKNVNFYFSDERCVPPEHPDSNYGMAMSTLFRAGIPKGCNVYRMEAESDDLEAAAGRYATVLPELIDISLISVGDDGHIASLFPFSAALNETKRRVLPIFGPKQPNQRLTITPPVILQSHSTVVFATGTTKAAVLVEALRSPNNIDALPVLLTIGGTWLLDSNIKSWIKNA